jgi:hypothetical protein
MTTVQVDEVLAGIDRVQKRLPIFKMDGHNPYFKSRYVTLSNILETLMPIAREEGLAITQPAVGENGEAGITTIVMHLKSQQHMEFTIVIPVGNQNAGQDAGKNVTYLRRYALASIFMIDSDEDIDGNTSRQQKEAVGEKQPMTKDTAELVDKYWTPLARQAEEYGIEFEPLPPNPTEKEVESSYLALQKALEEHK